MFAKLDISFKEYKIALSAYQLFFISYMLEVPQHIDHDALDTHPSKPTNRAGARRGVTRRGFLRTMLAGSTAVAIGAAYMSNRDQTALRDEQETDHAEHLARQQEEMEARDVEIKKESLIGTPYENKGAKLDIPHPERDYRANGQTINIEKINLGDGYSVDVDLHSCPSGEGEIVQSGWMTISPMGGDTDEDKGNITVVLDCIGSHDASGYSILTKGKSDLDKVISITGVATETLERDGQQAPVLTQEMCEKMLRNCLDSSSTPQDVQQLVLLLLNAIGQDQKTQSASTASPETEDLAVGN
jgi:hypothetical protein